MASAIFAAGIPVALFNQLNPKPKPVPWANIFFDEKRLTEVDEKVVAELKESIRGHGLIAPITIRETNEGGFKLICGLHRYLAWGQLRSDAIETNDEDTLFLFNLINALVLPASISPDLESILIIDENYCRKTLTPENRKSMAGQRRKLYLKLTGTPENGEAKGKVGAKGKKRGTEKNNTTEPTESVGPAWKALAESTGIKFQTIQGWWKSFTAEKGYPSSAPSTQPVAITNEFTEWICNAEKIKQEEDQKKAYDDQLAAIVLWLSKKLEEVGSDMISEAYEQVMGKSKAQLKIVK